MMPTDLGIEWLSSLDVFGLLLCLLLAIIGLRMRSFVFVLISSMLWMVLGIQIFTRTDEPIVFLLMFSIAVAQAFYGLRVEDRRR